MALTMPKHEEAI